MYKLLFSGVMLLASLSASAIYNSMEFKTADGAVKSVSATGLTIKVNGNQLIISNSAGETISFDALSLVSMQFVDGDAGVDSIITENEAVEAYTLDGLYAGKFNSVNEARLSLSNGVYVLKGTRGKSIKINVNK